MTHHLQETLDFLNKIEGQGYGGMAVFEIARQAVRHEVERPMTDIAQARWALDDYFCANCADCHLPDVYYQIISALDSLQSIQAERDALKAERDHWKQSSEQRLEANNRYLTQSREAIAQRDSANARIKVMREALKPFADTAAVIPARVADEADVPNGFFKVCELRRAASARAAISTGGTDAG